MDFQAEYRSKLRTPAEAVRAVKNGDWVDYTSALGFPPLLDAALAARRDELHDVKVRGQPLHRPGAGRGVRHGAGAFPLPHLALLSV